MHQAALQRHVRRSLRHSLRHGLRRTHLGRDAQHLTRLGTDVLDGDGEPGLVGDGFECQLVGTAARGDGERRCDEGDQDSGDPHSRSLSGDVEIERGVEDFDGSFDL